MKLPIKLFIILLVCVFASISAEAVSLQGCISSGLIGPNEHAHIATTPIRIYSITITPTANNGYALIAQTDTAARDTAAVGSGTEGNLFVYGRETSIKADLQSATSGNSIHFEYPDGINVDEQTFVSTVDAYVEVYYKP